MALSPPQLRVLAKPVERTRVMLVDDSAVIRGFLTRILQAESDMDIVASATDGAHAVATLKRIPAEVIILDVEMPNMDGMTAIPLLLQACPSVKIVMASTLTLKNASISLKALSAGAADYLAKPSAVSNFSGGGDFSRELVQKVRALGAAARRQVKTAQYSVPLQEQRKAPVLRPFASETPKYLAIGSSTGGPQALFTLLKHLAGVPQPILITQHMPASFTTILAEHITRQCGISCVEAQQGIQLRAGHVYVAPGNFHMTITKTGSVALNQEPAENYCRPSVDVMLRSLAQLAQPILAVILTGMGQDGLKGCQTLLSGNISSVMAQDEATSVVWGMPGAVANAGICSAVLPIEAIGQKIRQLSLKL